MAMGAHMRLKPGQGVRCAGGQHRSAARLAPIRARCTSMARLPTTCMSVMSRAPVARLSGPASPPTRQPQLHRPQHMGAALGRSSALMQSNGLQQRRQGRPYIAGASSRVGNRIIICAALAGVADATSVEDMLSQAIKPNQELVVGQLANGLRYVVMPNKTPPQRFEAHLEMHAGSVDEREHEQGVAHLVEHVTFLGSQRRESLLGTGARANAYTDFHHTVFHVHSPLTNALTGAPMLPQVLAALEEIAFKPQFLPLRIEKERKAVLAEAQMMNTVEYRVDCQLLTYLHHENALGCRFPIGKTEQVKTWEHSTLQNFWEKWYFPANATVYVVGDFMDRPTSEIVALIEKSFGHLPAARDKEAAALLARQQQHLNAHSHASNGSANGSIDSSASSSNGVAGAASASIPSVASNGAATASTSNGTSSTGAAVQAEVMEASTSAEVAAPLKARHAVRPPVEHKYGYGPMEPGETAVPVNIFRHPLLQHFMLSVFCKLPIKSLNKMGDLRRSFMIRVILSVFQFRVNARYVAANPPFVGVELDISDSGREGTAVSTLTVTAQPKDWEGAVQVAVEEERRLQRHGLTPGELDRYKRAMLRDSAQLSEQTNAIPHLDSLDFVMESLALGHTCMSHMEAHEAMVAVADTIDLDSVNALARSLLTFASDYGREAEVLDAVAAEGDMDSGLWGDFGPTRATSIVACVPSYMDASGSSIAAAGAGGRPRSAPMGAAGHLDADQLDLAALEKEAQQRLDDVEIPEGAMRFELEGAEIAAALSSPSLEVDPLDDVEVPDHLVPAERLEAMMAQMRPAFVQLDAAAPAESGNAVPAADPITGITRRRLSNGMRLNYRHTDNEPKAGLLRVVFSGGRATEAAGAGPAGSGAVAIGTRALSESGAMGDWRREEIEVFCITNLINCVLEADEEFIVMDFHFVVGDGGMQSLFELLHEFLRKPLWDDAALERAKQVYRSSVGSVHKSLERATADRIMDAMLGDDRRFRDPKADEIDALTLDGVRSAVQAQLHPANVEVSVVGDFDAEELESLCLQYLATIPPVPGAGRPSERPVEFKVADMAERHQTWHLRDSDERACAYIAGPAPCRWGPFGDRDPLAAPSGAVAPPPRPPPPGTPAAVAAAATAARRQHPLYSSVTLLLLTEIMNSRLFTTVRDSLGLTYDVSFEVTMFDRLRAGWFSASVTSYPDKIHEALAASLQVLRDLRTSAVTMRELMRAKRTLLTRHESDLKDNNYWLGLLTHLQNETVPLKTVECLRDLQSMYEAATVDDIYDAYSWLDLDDEALFTCVGTSGKAPPPPPDQKRLAMYSRRSSQFFGQDQQPAQGESDSMALFAALMTAAQSKNLAEAFKGVGQGLGRVAHDVFKQDKETSNEGSNGNGRQQ